MNSFIAAVLYVIFGAAILWSGCWDLHRYIRVRRTEKDGWKTLFTGVFALASALLILAKAYF